jgi:UDP-N-acetylglucosamine 2-epimerase (non-hydrolysing)
LSDARPRILVVYGTRPEVIKMAPVVAALRRRDAATVVVGSTGQHREMLDQAQALFGLVPDFDLGLMRPNQSLNGLLARAVEALDTVLVEQRFDWLLVQGDTTTAMAATLAAFHRGVRVGHVEAGLRTGDLAQPFPEEANRRLIDVVAAALFAPTARAAATLLAEGCAAERVYCVGNTVVDALQLVAPATARRDANGRRQVLVTVHRRESFGEPLAGILAALRQLAEEHPAVDWVYPVHPNPNVHGPAHAALGGLTNVRLTAPLDYSSLLGELRHSHLVLTDSGGIQEEAPAFGRPVLVLRETTERPEGVDAGVARLVGTDPDRIVAAASELLTNPAAHAAMACASNPYGDGHAAERIAAILAGDPWQPFAAATPGPVHRETTPDPDQLSREAAAAWQAARNAREAAREAATERDAMAARLRAVESTRAFRLAHQMWSLTHRLAPAGSRRHALLRRLRPGHQQASATAPPAESAAPSAPIFADDVAADLRRFAAEVTAAPSTEILLILAGTRFAADNIQRPAELARCAAQRGIAVVFAYFRWRDDDWVSPSRLGPHLLQLPLDLLVDDPGPLLTLCADRRRSVLCCLPTLGPAALMQAASSAGWTTIYDVLDDWEAFQAAGQAPWYDREIERLVAASAQRVLAVTPALAARVAALAGREVRVLGNGLRADFPTTISAPLALTRGAVTVGYFGDLNAAWFDWQLVADAARRQPRWRFHLVGSGTEPPAGLPPNVELLGRRPRHQLAALAANWDVAMVPFRQGDIAAAADPIKTYEYLALGLPVVVSGVAPPIGGEHLVTVAHDVDGLVAALAARATERDAAAIARRRQFAAEASWDARLDVLLTD